MHVTKLVFTFQFDKEDFLTQPIRLLTELMVDFNNN